MKPQLLYVEDDMFSRKVMQVLLEMVMQFEDVAIFENSENFLTRLQTLKRIPTLILLDIQMKPHDGFEVLQMLRETSAYAGAKVIALTANVMAHDITKLKEVGFDGLIGKPIMDDIFPSLIQRILDGEAIWYIP
jgi:two-component system cell cycle response regulator DivK